MMMMMMIMTIHQGADEERGDSKNKDKKHITPVGLISFRSRASGSVMLYIEFLDKGEADSEEKCVT